MPAGLQIACIETAERARHGPGSSVTGNTALAAFLLAGWADERPGTFAAVFLRGHTHTHILRGEFHYDEQRTQIDTLLSLRGYIPGPNGAGALAAAAR